MPSRNSVKIGGNSPRAIERFSRKVPVGIDRDCLISSSAASSSSKICWQRSRSVHCVKSKYLVPSSVSVKLRVAR
jgi:hypothetical protein